MKKIVVCIIVTISLLIGLGVGFIAHSPDEFTDYFGRVQYQEMEDSEKLDSPPYEMLDSGVKLTGERVYHAKSNTSVSSDIMHLTGKVLAVDFVCESDHPSGYLLIQVWFVNNTMFCSNKCSGMENNGHLLFRIPEPNDYYFQIIPESTDFSIYIYNYS